MRDLLGPGTVAGYCTNVHAGETWPQIRANLERHALRVKEIVSPREPMGIGLWMPAAAARRIVEERWSERIRDWLGEHGLRVFTFNGFPYGGFHEPVVKDRVYRPDWGEDRRAQFTLDLAAMLAVLVEEGGSGSISTLPLGWPGHGAWDEHRFEAAAVQIRRVAGVLERIGDSSGRRLHVDLEPEPGCVLQSYDGVVSFFERYLLAGDSADVCRRHVGVCHDICHAAVMFESQRDALAAYERAGIRVGKVQVSSAISLDLEEIDAGERRGALEELGRFDEERYLHQTMVRTRGRGELFPDLPEALRSRHAEDPSGAWRVHFHVPVHLERIGSLGTTSQEIGAAVRAARELHDCGHFEIETYAWDVLPERHREPSLAEGIARELAWFRVAFGCAS